MMPIFYLSDPFGRGALPVYTTLIRSTTSPQLKRASKIVDDTLHAAQFGTWDGIGVKIHVPERSHESSIVSLPLPIITYAQTNVGGSRFNELPWFLVLVCSSETYCGHLCSFAHLKPPPSIDEEQQVGIKVKSILCFAYLPVVFCIAFVVLFTKE